MPELTRQERQLKALMQFWTTLFALGAVAFLLFGDWILYAGNYFSVQIMKWSLPAMLLPVEKFWLSLTISMMATITMLCYYIQKDVRTNMALTSFLLVAKLTSTLVMFSAFFWDRPYFNYLMGSIFCDGPIFLITLIFYRRAAMSLTPACMKKPVSTP